MAPAEERPRGFKESAKVPPLINWEHVPMGAPRTEVRRVQFIAERGQHPRSRCTLWGHECGFGAAVIGVECLAVAMRFWGHASSCDQLINAVRSQAELEGKAQRRAESLRLRQTMQGKGGGRGEAAEGGE